MYDALKATMDGMNSNMKDTENACRAGDYQNDPFLALQCIGIFGGTAGRGGISARITKFQKIACEKADGKPGYVCDYAIRLNMSGLTLPPSGARIMNSEQVVHKRFVRTGDAWIALPAK